MGVEVAVAFVVGCILKEKTIVAVVVVIVIIILIIKVIIIIIQIIIIVGVVVVEVAVIVRIVLNLFVFFRICVHQNSKCVILSISDNE